MKHCQLYLVFKAQMEFPRDFHWSCFHCGTNNVRHGIRSDKTIFKDNKFLLEHSDFENCVLVYAYGVCPGEKSIMIENWKIGVLPDFLA